jgi:wyosine [tRNA(Phe)-imidazoG37] synthetase (radical SAM superfamily)
MSFGNRLHLEDIELFFCTRYACTYCEEFPRCGTIHNIELSIQQQECKKISIFQEFFHFFRTLTCDFVGGVGKGWDKGLLLGSLPAGGTT